MTKLVHVRVTLPVGDEVTTEAVQLAIRSSLEGIPPIECDQTKDDLRIHWSAVDVVRMVERGSSAADKRTLAKKTVVIGQGSLT